jgi:hypothetical protein
MAPGLPRSHLSSSTLIRLLLEHAGAEGPEAKQTFAERLSQWLGWTDAIALSAVLNRGPVPSSTVAAGRFMPVHAVLAEFERVRADLTHAIHTDRVLAPPPPAPAKVKVTKRPSAQPLAAESPAAPPDDPTDFAPCRRQLTAHQRTMTERIASLRADVRLALTNQSAALGQLAAVDAVMDDALAAREKHVLSLVPALLERRFDKLRDANRAPAGVDASHALADARATPLGPAATAGHAAHAAHAAHAELAAHTAHTAHTAHPARTAPAAPAAQTAPPAPPAPQAVPAWRIACGREMQDVLLAELDLRLQPVHGMIDALVQDSPQAAPAPPPFGGMSQLGNVPSSAREITRQ